jgi:hypothetical protein
MGEQLLIATGVYLQTREDRISLDPRAECLLPAVSPVLSVIGGSWIRSILDRMPNNTWKRTDGFDFGRYCPKIL